MERQAMIRNRILGAGLVVVMAGPAYAQVSESRIRELIAQAAAQSGAAMPAPATQTQTPAGQRPTVRLSLDDAVKAALDRNLDIAVQRLNPEINDIAYASVAAVYHPNLTSTIG